MNVLVTGAFGWIGTGLVDERLRRGHRVRVFDLPSMRRRAIVTKRWRAVDAHWGDVRDFEVVRTAVENQNVIIHLACIIPPGSNSNPRLAKDVNVNGTATLIKAATALDQPPRIIYTSSFHVFGWTSHLPPPRRIGDPVQAVDPYSEHKLQCEAMLMNSGLDWMIMRLAYVPRIGWRSPPALLFEVPLHTRIETLHLRDVASALTNAVDCDEAFGRILLVGGGPRCQILYGDYLDKTMKSLGLGPSFPEKAFGLKPYPTDWLDTSESQRLLQYQHHSFDDLIEETARNTRFRRPFVTMLRPLIRYAVLRSSPYLRRV